MTLSPAQQVKELFLAAREMDIAARQRFLLEACGSDEGARRRVEALIRAETALGPNLLSPAPMVAAAPDQIDRYEILDVIGEGGFGTVYRARRTHGVQAEVAIKVLRAGLETSAALARFGAEQRSLEAMDHPGIARVLDAGVTASGRPFIVMELVRGAAITTFCEQAGLDTLERMKLMAEVCRAVQHAHNKGVIHRDLKPSNILAWKSDGQVWAKVIDFGIAKFLEQSLNDGASVATTRPHEIVGTPAYMSPEQARGPHAGDVDTRADVYALGAVLYELLSGKPVLDAANLAGASPAAVERVICEVEPPSPSQRVKQSGGEAAARLFRKLQGEIDWVTMRALEKDRARRYPTAQALADDLERILRGDAVVAAPPSRVYRISRVMRREPGLFVGLAAALLAMVVGTGVSVRQSMRAREAEVHSERARRVSDAINNFLRTDLLAAVSPSGAGPGRGRDVKMREVLDEASRRIEASSLPGGSLEREPLVQAGVRGTLAHTYFALGEFPLALEHARESERIYARELGPESQEVLAARVRGAWTLRSMGRFHESLAAFQDAYDVALRTQGERAAITLDAAAGMAGVYSWGLFDRPQAERLWRRVYEIRRQTEGPDNPMTLEAGQGLGIALYFAERFKESQSLLEDVHARRLRVLGPMHPGTIGTEFFLARIGTRIRADDFDATEEALVQVLAKARTVFGERHITTLAIMQDLGDYYKLHRMFTRALGLHQAQYDMKRETLGDDHIDTISAASSLGETLGELGFKAEALALLRDSLDRQRRLPPKEAPGLPATLERYLRFGGVP